MTTDNPLVAKVKRLALSSGPMDPFSAATIGLLQDAKDEFVLAPDLYVDVARLPPGVTTLPLLISHLRAIKEKMKSRPNGIKTADWDVAKSGELRQYKLYVCCIHSLCDYVSGSPDYSMSVAPFVANSLVHAKGNVPTGLSKGGKELWENTFGPDGTRTVAVMTSLVFFCLQPVVAAPEVPSAPKPDLPGGDVALTPEDEEKLAAEHRSELVFTELSEDYGMTRRELAQMSSSMDALHEDLKVSTGSVSERVLIMQSILLIATPILASTPYATAISIQGYGADGTRNGEDAFYLDDGGKAIALTNDNKGEWYAFTKEIAAYWKTDPMECGEGVGVKMTTLCIKLEAGAVTPREITEDAELMHMFYRFACNMGIAKVMEDDYMAIAMRMVAEKEAAEAATAGAEETKS